MRKLEKNNECGFTLLEVVISIFLLGITSIGVGSLFLTAFRTTQQSAYQTTALDMASVMADKIRASARLTKTDHAENPYLAVNYQSSASANAEAPPKLCYALDANCSVFDIANAQIYEWEMQLKATLPGGRAVVCRDSASWNNSASSYHWNCDNNQAASVVIKIGWLQKGLDEVLGKDKYKESPPSVVLNVQPGEK